MSETAIKVDSISKTFKLPHEKQGSIKNIFINIFQTNKRTFEKQEVLNDISFEIKKGEFFGIVGRNGSGKSTLLKLLAGIYSPDSGVIEVNGKLTPFIELGVGFNPELTGRENVFLNGALLGFSREEMATMYDEIVKFAELEKFMDLKLKNYSSGMQVRLAFSVAVKVDSPILLLDEVLAVGDQSFQQKCYNYFEDLKSQKKTVVFVSHDMNAIRRFCDKVCMLEKGEIRLIASPEPVIQEYTKLFLPNSAEIKKREVSRKQPDEEKIKEESILKTIETANSDLIKTAHFSVGQKIFVNLSWAKDKNVNNVGVALFRNDETYIFGTNTVIDKVDIGKLGKITYTLECKLAPGRYYFQIGLFGKSDRDVVGFYDKASYINISGSDEWQGAMFLDHKWEIG